MQYRRGKHGEEISVLGYGCMRFTRKGGRILLDKAEAELMAALEAGVNYFDTAYIYPGSEAALGEIFQRNHCREKLMIAAKLPQYLLRSPRGIDRFFDEERRRLQTDYLDFYLMHMLPGTAGWEKLRALGIEEWIRRKKEAGEIRNIGFSYHGDSAAFLELLDAYPWDFCQIQYNYMDENSQAGRKGLEEAARRGIPVIIMEPLRGGQLADRLPTSARELLEREGRGRSAAEWGLSWLWDQPGVTCVLSGMNSLAMVEENCRIADQSRPGAFTAEDFAFIDRLRQILDASMRIGCTGCGYCQPCPRGVNIPGIFRCLNEIPVDGLRRAKREYLQNNGLRRPSTGAGQCIGCGECETRCPQHLPIREGLAQAARELEDVRYRAAETAYRLLKL